MPEINAPAGKGEPEEITFDGARLSFILIGMIIPFYFLGDKFFHVIWNNRVPAIAFHLPLWAEISSLLLAILLHEFIHGAIFAFYAVHGFKSVRFGFNWQMGAFYCHCQDPLKVKEYRRAGIAPLIILGLLPLVVAYLTGLTWLKTFGLLLTIGGFGDLLIYIKLFTFDPNLIIRDHPEKLGFIIENNNQL